MKPKIAKKGSKLYNERVKSNQKVIHDWHIDRIQKNINENHRIKSEALKNKQ